MLDIHHKIATSWNYKIATPCANILSSSVGSKGLGKGSFWHLYILASTAWKKQLVLQLESVNSIES